jgi:hypothetical protein
MPINYLAGFSPADDLHILRGASPISLPKLLQVNWGVGEDAKTGSLEEYVNTHGPVPDVVVEFRPTFQYPLNQPTFENFKIRISRGLGELTVLAGSVPEPKPHNFIIEATLTFNGIAPLPKEKIARLRVHVHESVERIWMTPSRMTVTRPAASGAVNTFFRFTVRAQFDDGSAADISNTEHYTVDPIDADFLGGGMSIRLPASATAGTVRTISFRTTTDWNNQPAHADIAVVEPWSSATNVPKAELIDGHPDVWSGKLKPERLANILFFGIGFRPLDGEAFKALTNMLVNRMRTDRRFAPYRYLATSINYWRTLVPASEAGISVRCEVFSFVRDGQRFALPVPAPAPPPETGPWKLANLVFVAGLPVPSDLNFVREQGQTQPPSDLDAFNEIAPERLDFSLLVGKWAATVSPEFAQSLNALTPTLLKKWLSLSNRTFIDEVDNYPNVAVGFPPSMRPDFDDSGELNFHGYRGGGLMDLDTNPERKQFYRRLDGVAASGTTIALDGAGDQPTELGNLWAEDRSSFAFDNRSFVVALCNMPIGRSERFLGRSNWKLFEGLFLRPTFRLSPNLPNPPLSLDLHGLPVAVTAGRTALRLDLPPLASLEALPETWEVYAHELSHAFGLGDEYSEPVPSPPTVFGTDLPFPNVTLTNLILRPDRSVQPGGIKWNWHRIRKAGVITRPIEEMFNGLFRVFVAKDGGLQFKPGEDVVRLRQRVPREALKADPPTSIVEFIVQSVHPENLSDDNDKLNMTIVIRNESVGIDVTPFQPGSLIYVPVPAPDSVRTLLRPYLTLVSPAAERIMETIGGTMSGKDCDTSNMEVFRARVQVPRLPFNELSSLASRSDMTTIVGAYYGGAQAACEVVHPAGSCIMRTGTDSYTIFCPVCRYALVDRIDPEKHWLNDVDYDKEYSL